MVHVGDPAVDVSPPTVGDVPPAEPTDLVMAVKIVPGVDGGFLADGTPAILSGGRFSVGFQQQILLGHRWSRALLEWDLWTGSSWHTTHAIPGARRRPAEGFHSG